MNPDGTPNGETNNGEPVSNNAPTTTQSTVTPEQYAEVVKKAEQAEMRARQLENQAREREKADDAVRQRQLEEQGEYKTLAEREKERADRLELEIETSKRQGAISTAESSIISNYSDDVRELAATTGLTLFDDTEDAKVAYKAKLDAIAAKFPGNPAPRVQGNNGNTPPPIREESDVARARATMRMRVDKASGVEAIGNLAVMDDFRALAGVTRKEQTF